MLAIFQLLDSHGWLVAPYDTAISMQEVLLDSCALDYLQKVQRINTCKKNTFPEKL